MKIEDFVGLGDPEIIDRIREQNESHLFSILYKRYELKVYNKCYSLVKNKSLAEEFVQDIFATVCEKLSFFRGNSSFSTWLYTITYNHCIEYFRKKSRHNYADYLKQQDIAEDLDETEEEEISNIRYERLLVLMDTLHPEEKTILMMKYYDNMPLKLIQSALNINESAAKMRIKRAKNRVLSLYRKKYSDA